MADIMVVGIQPPSSMRLDYFFLGTPTNNIRKKLREVDPKRYAEHNVRACFSHQLGGPVVVVVANGPDAACTVFLPGSGALVVPLNARVLERVHPLACGVCDMCVCVSE